MSILILPKNGWRKEEKKNFPNVFQRIKKEKIDNSILGENFGVINYMWKKIHMKRQAKFINKIKMLRTRNLLAS